MNAYDAYKKYVAIKLHFQQKDYDYFKFGGSSRVSREKFDTRNDKYFFERIAKIYDADQFEQLLVSNFVVNKNVWIGDIVSETGRNRLVAWKKTRQSLEYIFKEDMKKIKQYIDDGKIRSFDSLFEQGDENWPEIVTLALQETINMETFIVINKALNFLPRMSAKIQDTIVWPEFQFLCNKYTPFLKVDIKIYKNILRKTFVENACT